MFGVPANPQTTAATEFTGDEMWAKCENDTPCFVEIPRQHNDLCVFSDVMSGKTKMWVGNRLVFVMHKPKAAGTAGGSPTATFVVDVRGKGIADATAFLIGICNSVTTRVTEDKVPAREKNPDGEGGRRRPREEGVLFVRRALTPEEIKQRRLADEQRRHANVSAAKQAAEQSIATTQSLQATRVDGVRSSKGSR